MTYDLQQGEVSNENVVERDIRHYPRIVVCELHFMTHCLVIDDCVWKLVSIDVDTATVLATEQIDAHDAEYQPEDETDKQYVEDGRDGLDQCVDDYLHVHTHTRQPSACQSHQLRSCVYVPVYRSAIFT